MRPALAACAVVLLVAGCSSDEPAVPEAAPATAPKVATPPTAPPPATTEIPPAPETKSAETKSAETKSAETKSAETTSSCAGDVVRMVTPRRAYAAIVPKSAIAYREPGGARLASFGRLNVNRYPTTFGVLAKRLDDACRPAWYRVQLPLRPNGVTGWVRAADVELREVRTRIVVELSKRRVTLYEDGRETFSTTAAIGTSATPTPTGSYYVNQRLVPTDKTGPFGPGAIGISAFSPVLTGWAQGGPIAIHGTNRPDLIGRAVSNGCVRVRNDHLLYLFERAVAGTPVLVRA